MLPSRELPASKPVVAVAAVVGLALVVVGAVALGLVGGGAAALEDVPDGVDAVIRIDGAALDDPVSRSLFDAGVDTLTAESTSAEASIATVESRTGLSLDAVEEVVAFAQYDANGNVDVRYAGAIVHADWSGEDVGDALATTWGLDYEATTYEGPSGGGGADGGATQEGTTVYQPAGAIPERAPVAAVLDDGKFFVGSPLVVDDAIRVHAGEADALGGPLADAFASVNDGLVTVASELPQERVAAFDERTEELTRLGRIRAVAGTYDTSGESLSITARLRTNGTEAARDVTDVTRGGLPILASDVDDRTVADLLGSVDVEREGHSVSIHLETTVEELRALARYYGLGASGR